MASLFSILGSFYLYFFVLFSWYNLFFLSSSIHKMFRYLNSAENTLNFGTFQSTHYNSKALVLITFESFHQTHVLILHSLTLDKCQRMIIGPLIYVYLFYFMLMCLILLNLMLFGSGTKAHTHSHTWIYIRKERHSLLFILCVWVNPNKFKFIHNTWCHTIHSISMLLWIIYEDDLYHRRKNKASY